MLWWYSWRIKEAFTQMLHGPIQDQTRLNAIMLDAQESLQRTTETAAAGQARLEAEVQELRRAVDRLQNSTGDFSGSLYVAFEKVFRGSRDDIKQRQSVYLPFLKEREHLRGLPTIDLGCGRGEWLELLRDNGFDARGIDVNPAMLESCLQLGLSVSLGDGLEYLQSLPESSLGVVTAFHVVEHLPVNRMIDLIASALRVLAPGGLLILETPNPANIRVAAHSFFIDPTHQRPVPSELLIFLVGALGFTSVQALALHPQPETAHVPEAGPLAERFNEAFYGPQDYGVVAVKPMPRSTPLVPA